MAFEFSVDVIDMVEPPPETTIGTLSMRISSVAVPLAVLAMMVSTVPEWSSDRDERVGSVCRSAKIEVQRGLFGFRRLHRDL